MSQANKADNVQIITEGLSQLTGRLEGLQVFVKTGPLRIYCSAPDKQPLKCDFSNIEMCCTGHMFSSCARVYSTFLREMIAAGYISGEREAGVKALLNNLRLSPLMVVQSSWPMTRR